MFMAALFTITKIQKYSKGPSIDEWIMKTLWGCKELDTTEHLYTHTHTCT